LPHFLLAPESHVLLLPLPGGHLDHGPSDQFNKELASLHQLTHGSWQNVSSSALQHHAGMIPQSLHY
jgi:hypothetical protein